jgi:cytidine deaminase
MWCAMTDRHTLVAAARAAALHAHAPYSGFAVGAAVLLANGEIITGCNFENASYGLSLCAETVALATVNAQGKLREVREMAVIGGMLTGGLVTGTDPVTPCGRCRQVINEAAALSGCDIAVHCGAAEGSAINSYTLSEILPHAFGPGDLQIR